MARTEVKVYSATLQSGQITTTRRAAFFVDPADLVASLEIDISNDRQAVDGQHTDESAAYALDTAERVNLVILSFADPALDSSDPRSRAAADGVSLTRAHLEDTSKRSVRIRFSPDQARVYDISRTQSHESTLQLRVANARTI